MTIFVKIDLRVNADSVATFLDLALPHLNLRREAPGCERVLLLQNVDRPSHFTLLEQFESQSTIDSYYDSSEYRHWLTQAKPLIVSITGADQTVLLDDA